ncbi:MULTISPECIES: EndoU domain-containing protein [Chryseobacterium]|uniref:EndoU nuclease n=1 Tax=Chryseobacterium scophthalmum TaxID=59733 RepID=A0A1N6HLE5_9FLAO|nr:EndoU domain-containing protein [Chryseobacterium scophthalmum]SIO20664.1 EndoU nuclease [Chryseobacterium scophthalmum]
MGNMWNCIIFDTKIKDGEKLCTLKNKEGTITYFEDIPEEKFDYLLDDIEKKAKKEGKTANEYLDELARSESRKIAYRDFINEISRRNLNDLIDHIFHGHLRTTLVRRRGRLPSTKGVHSEEFLDNIINRIKPGSRRPPNPLDDEIYHAEVQMKDVGGNWIDKLAPNGNVIQTTMFPKNWDKQRILEEVAVAWKNKIVDPSNADKFIGTTTNNIEVTFYINNTTREIGTAFPIF